MDLIVLLLNLQNEVVDPKGNIGARGNARQIAARGTLENVAALLRGARCAGLTVIHAGTVYDSDYSTLNRSAPQFATAAREGRLRAGSWEAQFHPLAAPRPGEPVLRRGGVGLFATTDLHARLPTPDRTHILIAGVSTRLVVEAAVFELTDRGYAVTVLEDCCAAQTADAHDAALEVLSRFGRVQTAAEALADSPLEERRNHADARAETYSVLRNCEWEEHNDDRRCDRGRRRPGGVADGRAVGRGRR